MDKRRTFALQEKNSLTHGSLIFTTIMSNVGATRVQKQEGTAPLERVSDRLANPLTNARFDAWRGQRLLGELMGRTCPGNDDLERTVLGTMIVAWDDPEARRSLHPLDFHGCVWKSLFMAARKYLRLDTPREAWIVRVKSLCKEAARTVGWKCPECWIKAELTQAMLVSQVKNMRENIVRLRQLRVARERVYVATELLRLAYTIGQWDDATEQWWMTAAEALVKNLRISVGRAT